ncbi:MAG: peptidoglycan DD-metalloendopeptidase family protein [Rhodospirillales bacterium]|nr:peptidoglycan DD-metalloendopeptidase family protein [Rhodospirillales bacterium]MCB9973444.1 peptidoglycan DD-metalloendopeptidase family protein [Rhodospirillales bacterium]
MLPVFVVLLAICGQGQAWAAEAPPQHEKAYKDLQEDLKKEKNRLSRLEQQEALATQEIQTLQERTIPLGTMIQTAESNLTDLKTRIDVNEAQKNFLAKKLKENQRQLSDGLLAALRLRRIPSETLFIQTATPLETARTALLLEHSMPGLKAHLDKVSLTANALAELQQELTRQHEEQAQILARMKQEQDALGHLIANRQALIKETHYNYRETEKKAETLAKEAADLQELMKKIQLQNKMAALRPRPKPVRRAVLQKEEKPSLVASAKAPTSPPPSGPQSGWPVAGRIEAAYGTPDQFGAKSEGIRIATRPGALVTSPMDGRIRFAGPFKNYKKIIIIEHRNDWHSLIAGLDKIDVLVGQSVKAGEPVGIMSSQIPSEGLLLYYELRYKGEPVNPAQKIKNLG